MGQVPARGGPSDPAGQATPPPPPSSKGPSKVSPHRGKETPLVARPLLVALHRTHSSGNLTRMQLQGIRDARHPILQACTSDSTKSLPTARWTHAAQASRRSPPNPTSSPGCDVSPSRTAPESAAWARPPAGSSAAMEARASSRLVNAVRPASRVAPAACAQRRATAWRYSASRRTGATSRECSARCGRGSRRVTLSTAPSTRSDCMHWRRPSRAVSTDFAYAVCAVRRGTRAAASPKRRARRAASWTTPSRASVLTPASSKASTAACASSSGASKWKRLPTASAPGEGRASWANASASAGK